MIEFILFAVVIGLWVQVVNSRKRIEKNEVNIERLTEALRSQRLARDPAHMPAPTVYVPQAAPPPAQNSSSANVSSSGTADIPNGGSASIPNGGSASIPNGGSASIPNGGSASIPNGGSASISNGGSAAFPPASPLPPADDHIWEDDVAAPLWQDQPPAPQAPAPQSTTPHQSEQPQTVRSAKPAVHMAASAAPVKKQDGNDFELRFGKSLPVWVGGIALALSGFFLVKYSIEQGLLTASVRVALGFALGLAALFGGHFIRTKRPGMADGTRISQALTGAGVAILYGTFFAATKFYGMPRAIGFGGMAGVTALAVLLSLRHGMAIAALGLLGGFATPALLSDGHRDTMGLFVYLFLLCAGIFALIRSRNWWVLAVPTLLLSFFWTLGWILSGDVMTGDIWPALFLLGIAATTLVSSDAAAAKETAQDRANEHDWNLISGYIAAGGAMILMAMLTVKANFGLMEWGMYGLLGAGALVMSWFKPAQYRYAPWVSMAVTAVMILCWEQADAGMMSLTILGFGLLYGLGALFFLRRSPSLEHGATLSAAALGFYGLGYLRLGHDIYRLTGLALPVNASATLATQPHFWGALAIGLAACFTLLTTRAVRRPDLDGHVRARLSALFCLMTTAFMSIALLIEVHKDFLPVAFALELAAVCWVYTRVNIAFLRQIAALLFYAFWLLLAPQILLLAQIVINSLVDGNIPLTDALVPPVVAQPLFHLMIPALAMAGGSWLLNRRHDSKLAEMLETAACALGLAALYFLLRRAFHPLADLLTVKAGFLERGVVTNLFFATALGIVYGGRMFARRALLWSGSALFGLALFRVGYFDFFLYNPLGTAQAVGDGLVFNSLPITYGLPLFWLWLEEQPALRIYVAPGIKGAGVLLLVFTLVTLEVRQAFHGSIITLGQHMTNAEIYSYSAAWLALGVLMLVLGTLRKHKPLRVAALVLMMLTSFKVFLYDAGELEGLYRVFAFMGLGLTLMALSWFYTRFVLNDKTGTDTQ